MRMPFLHEGIGLPVNCLVWHNPHIARILKFAETVLFRLCFLFSSCLLILILTLILYLQHDTSSTKLLQSKCPSHIYICGRQNWFSLHGRPESHWPIIHSMAKCTGLLERQGCYTPKTSGSALIQNSLQIMWLLWRWTQYLNVVRKSRAIHKGSG